MNHKLSFFCIDNLSYKYSNLSMPKLYVPRCIVPYVGITAVVGGALGIMGSSIIFHNYYPPLKNI